MEAIEINEVDKKFGKLHALKKVSLSIHKREIFGLLGPNGAGKSTLIRLISGNLKPGKGSIEVLGKPLDKRVIGVTPQENSFYEELTVRENLVFFSHMYGVPGSKIKKKIKDLIHSLNLENKRHVRAKYLSGGMKKRLSIGCSLVHDPKILILDEPTVGLDPDARQVLWKIINDTNEKGVTIIITTHYMDEADSLCDRVAIMNEGRVIAVGEPSNLRDLVGEDVIEFRTFPGTAIHDLLSFAEIVPTVSGVRKLPHYIEVRTKESEKVLPKLIKYSEKIGEEVIGVNVRKSTLEDVFMALTIGETGKPVLKESKEQLARAKVPEEKEGGVK